MMGWQQHQLDHMQIICASLQTDNHTSIPPLSFFTSRMPFLPPNQQHQSTEGVPNGWSSVTYIVTGNTHKKPKLWVHRRPREGNTSC